MRIFGCNHNEQIHFYQESCGRHWHVVVCWVCSKVLEKNEWLDVGVETE